MKVLHMNQILKIHQKLIEESGGSFGIREEKVLNGCLAQPFMTFGGQDLYPDLIDKAATLCFSLVSNHPFVDGNKRIGHAAMEIFLMLNGLEIQASVNLQEATILAVASGEMDRETFTEWVRNHVIIFPS